MPIVWCFAADDCLVKSQPCQSHWVIEQFLEVIWRQTQIVTSYIFKIRLPNKLVIVLMRVAKPNRHDKKKITEITYLGHEQLLSPQWTPCWFTQKHGLEFKLKWTLYHLWRCIPVKFLWDDIFVCLFGFSSIVVRVLSCKTFLSNVQLKRCNVLFYVSMSVHNTDGDVLKQ